MTEQSADWLSESEWDAAQRMVPILCVDAVPVRRIDDVVQIGLIQRHNPFGPDAVWCQIGGRVRRDELLTSALHRHLLDALDGIEIPLEGLEGDVQPVYVKQWLADGSAVAPWVGTDPRRHAVSLCYSIPVTEQLWCRAGGEALAFAWFEPSRLADLPDIWPGTAHLVGAVLAGVRSIPGG